MTNRLARRFSAVLLMLAAGLFALVGAALITGQAAVVITHGVSMNPVYYQGDLVIIAKDSTYAVGDIAAYNLPNKDEVALHRIVGGDAQSYVFKGDNNESVDPLQPGADELVGRAILHVPHAGTWLTILTSPPVLGVIAFALIASGGTAAATRKNRRKRRAAVSRHLSERPAKRLPDAGLSISSLSPSLRTAGGTAAVLAVLGASLGAAAWAGPLEESSSAAVQSGTSMKFSYTADVGRSAAYDGTTAVSPDPVFRKLADTVQVDFAYEGEPGTVSVNAELSSPSGWRSTVPLAEGQAFSGNTYDGTVTLDLDALEAKADAAAAATGLASSPVAVSVVPEVTTESGAAFSPELKLSLAPLQLSLVGGEGALTITDSSSSQRTVMAPRTIGFDAWSITAEAARFLSALLLLAGVVLAAVVLFLARRSGPVDEATAILRRYANLLVRVHPMPAAQGRPVIEVTTFATLAKLAERYGLLVLHWNRSGVETFIVQDENITYRYRSGAGHSPAELPAAAPDTHDATSGDYARN